MSPIPFAAQIPQTPHHLCIHHVLEDWAERTPDAPAILAPGRTPLAYGCLYEHVDSLIQTLHGMGVGRHDRVALVLPNSPEMAVAFLAVASAGTCAPLNPTYSTSEFEFYLTDLGVKALIVQERMDSPARATAQALGIPIIELSPILEADAGLFTLTTQAESHAASHGFSQHDDTALILHTSATTSRPKIVPLTHTNICTAVYNTCVALKLTANDRCLNVLPLFHAHGLVTALFGSLMAGASVVCPPGFIASQFFAWMADFRPTWYTAVPTIHQAILASATPNQEIIAHCPLRFIRSSSASLAPHVLNELERVFQAPVLEAYSMTEATSQITCNPLPPQARKIGSVGVATGPEVAIMDEIGTLLPAGEVGEVVIRGASVIQGYPNNPIANQDAFTHGWFRTGDQGYLDTADYLFVTGRLKDLINRGGQKISPQEVDEVFMRHPAVAQALTFPVPHTRLGEDVAVAVVLHQNATATDRDIREFAVAHLADYKVPRQVFIVDSLPHGPTGKLQRRALATTLGLTTFDRSPSGILANYTAPRTPVEKLLAGLWAQMLDLDRVGIYDNFSQLGGDSILATQLISRVREMTHVELSLRSFFEAPTVTGIARNIDNAYQAIASPQAPPLQPMLRDNALPLSYAQQRLWFFDQLEPGCRAYNLSSVFRFRGVLHVTALEKSLGEIVHRHEILRTTFPAEDGRPVQVIAPVEPFTLPVFDLRSFPEVEREVEIQRRITSESKQMFDLARGPLWRINLLRLADDEHVFLLSVHHIVFDSWSFDVFFRELTALYGAFSTDKSVRLPTLPIQYGDFALWQRAWLQEEVLEAQLAYWKRQLGDSPRLLELPTDRPRPPLQTFRGAYQSLVIPQHLTQALKALNRQQGVTLFMLLLAAFKTLLYRYTGQADLLVGTPIAGRTRIETEELIGFFTNILALRTRIGKNPRFQEVLGKVREVTLGAYDHQDLPFEQLVARLRPERSHNQTPLVTVMFTLDNAPRSSLKLPGLSCHQLEVRNGATKFDLTLSMIDTEQGLVGSVEYATDLFDSLTIARMLGHFQTLLEGIVAEPERRIWELPFLTAAERQQLLVEWNDTIADYPQETCIHQLFEAQSERMSDTVAVICEANQLTYNALNQWANQLAHYLQALGVGPEVCVGLCVERSLEMVAGLLGILKSGGAYVPLDPAYPPERLGFMLADAHVRVLVTQKKFIDWFPGYQEHLVCLDTDWEHIARQSKDNTVSGAMPENLAYVMYTSGSTGEPKGVMIEHRQVLAFLHGFEHVAPGSVPCIGTSVCPFGFDVSVWECFSTLCFGGTLHILHSDVLIDTEHFVRYLVDQHITSAYIPPALLPNVASHLERWRDRMALDRILVGVEPIQQDILQRFRDLSTHLRIANGYGPTETTICATLFPFRSATEPDRRTPIGTGIRGYEVYLVDANMQLLPIGIPGELLIGGIGLARGYLNHPELTAEKFIPHPFSDVSSARLYKSGDLARYLPDGSIEFLGRLDQQFKIRGYRIEPGEIEAVLKQHPAVHNTIVVAQNDHLGVRRLVAYLVVSQEPAPSPHVLRHFLEQKLPVYMVPSVFVMLEALPLDPNGKVDRQALPTPDTTRSPFVATGAAPCTTTEHLLADIWTEVLGLKQVGIYDNFFELGGDSILSIQIVARANQAGLRLTPKQLFQHQRIVELAEVAGTIPAIQAEQGVVTGSVPLTPIQRWFFEQSLPDPQLWNQTLLLEMRQPLDVSGLERVVQHILVHHDILRARFTRGAAGWQQYITDDEQTPVCDRVDLSALSETQQRAVIAETTAQLQASLNLTDGPLVQITLFDFGPHKPAHLLVVIHHLVVDGISWRLLLEDLQIAYQQVSSGRAIQLPPKTTSFKYWSEQLTIYAQTDALQQELSYWLAENHIQISCLPVDYLGGTNTVSLARTVSVWLSIEETRALLQDVPQAYQTYINDVLLTALIQAFAHWTGVSSLLVDVEGHGREEIIEGVDLSRTVGWFTTLFPVLLQLNQGFRPEQALKSVKEQLRRVPNHGIGFGLLRYLCQKRDITEVLQTLPQAEVCFNYLGQFDQVLPAPALFGLAQESIGAQRSLWERRHYLFEVNGCIVGGQLQIDWTYSEHIHRRATVESLAYSFIETLRLLIVHCQSPDTGGYTPSDFPNMQLNQQELDDLIATLDESVEGDER